jgi:hypothetical protein
MRLLYVAGARRTSGFALPEGQGVRRQGTDRASPFVRLALPFVITKSSALPFVITKGSSVTKSDYE